MQSDAMSRHTRCNVQVSKASQSKPSKLEAVGTSTGVPKATWRGFDHHCNCIMSGFFQVILLMWTNTPGPSELPAGLLPSSVSDLSCKQSACDFLPILLAANGRRSSGPKPQIGCGGDVLYRSCLTGKIEHVPVT